MLDWFRGVHDWRKLFRYKDRLLGTSGSAFRDAFFNDPDLAAVLAQEPDPPPSKVPGHGFSPLMHKLTNIEDLLVKVIYATAHMDPSDAPESERPEPLYLELRRQLRKKSMSRLLANYD